MSKKKPLSMNRLAQRLRHDLNEKGGNQDFILIYAHNGTGKTRLSMAFKDAGKRRDSKGDTLYFNAFTEDLFTWDNDLEANTTRILRINPASRFFAGVKELEMESRIQKILHCYADFDFRIDYEKWTISFSRSVTMKSRLSDDLMTTRIDDIKVSRGEENIFIWSFFMAIVQLVVSEEISYNWVKYIYIDDPISSLDDNNVIAVASNLSDMLVRSKIKVVISSHHTLFFNILCNAFKYKKIKRYFLDKADQHDEYTLINTNDTPFFHHVAILIELHKAVQSGKLYTYHFNMLRTVLEKTASFHGFAKFSACIKQDSDDPDGIIYTRIINILSHGNYSLYEPQEMVQQNKDYFKKILADFMNRYAFNMEIFPKDPKEIQ